MNMLISINKSKINIAIIHTYTNNLKKKKITIDINRESNKLKQRSCHRHDNRQILVGTVQR